MSAKKSPARKNLTKKRDDNPVTSPRAATDEKTMKGTKEQQSVPLSHATQLDPTFVLDTTNEQTEVMHPGTRGLVKKADFDKEQEKAAKAEKEASKRDEKQPNATEPPKEVKDAQEKGHEVIEDLETRVQPEAPKEKD